MEASVVKELGNVSIILGLMVAAIGLAMWTSSGHTAALGFVVAGNGFFLKRKAMQQLGFQAQPSVKYVGMALFVLGLLAFALKIAGR